MAGVLDDAEKVGDARGYLVFTGSYSGQPLTVATSGVGSPSMSIAVEELAACGTHTMIRVGSSAAISDRLPVGGLMVAMAAVCDEGTSRYYAPPNFPPVAARQVVDALVEAATALDTPVEVGLTRSTDSFYEGERVASIIELWRGLGVLTFEMETSCLFTVAAKLGLEAGSIVCVGSNLLTGEATPGRRPRRLRHRPGAHAPHRARRRECAGRRQVSATLLLRGGTIVTVTNGVIEGDVYVEDGGSPPSGPRRPRPTTSSTSAGCSCCRGSSRPTSTSVRPCCAAWPTTSTSSTGCASACGRWSSLTTRRRSPPRPSSPAPSCCSAGRLRCCRWSRCTTPTR